MQPKSDGKPLQDSAVPPHLRDWNGAASVLGVTPRMVRELWARREISGVRVGKHVRFRDADLADYIERHRVEAKQ